MNQHQKYMCLGDMHHKTYPVLGKPVSFIAMILIGLFLFSACEKDEGPSSPPVINLLDQTGTISSDTTVGAGSLMTFSIEATGTVVNVTNLIVKVTDGQEIQRYLDTSMNTSSFVVRKSFVKSLADEETWTFIIRDKNRMSDSVSLIIKKDTAAGYGPIAVYENLTLSAQNKPDPGSFFSFISEEVYPLEAAAQHQELLDLVYYFGEDDHTLASPGANIESGIFEGDLAGWDVRRTTRFIELEMAEEVFAAAQNDSLLLASYTEGSGKRKSKFLAPGKTFSFRTEDFKYGIFRVKEVEGTDAGTVLIDMKVQDK